jgi:hypothetical protein
MAALSSLACHFVYGCCTTAGWPLNPAICQQVTGTLLQASTAGCRNASSAVCKMQALQFQGCLSYRPLLPDGPTGARRMAQLPPDIDAGRISYVRVSMEMPSANRVSTLGRHISMHLMTFI